MSKNYFTSENESSGIEDIELIEKKKKSQPVKKNTTSSSSNYKAKNIDLQSDDAASEIEDGEIIDVPKKRSMPSVSSASKKMKTASTYRSNSNRQNEGVDIEDSEAPKKKNKSSSVAKKTASPLPSTSKYKPTVADLFGEDSDDEKASSNIGKDPPKLACYISRRVANGYAKQFHPNKKGALYVELKIYECDEIEKISPMNRWRQAIISLKTRDNSNSESWRYLSKYVKAARAQFESCHTAFTNYS